MSRNPGPRPLLLVATLNVGSHLGGLVAAFLWMRPGTVLAPLDARMAFLAARPPGWSFGWGTWMLCSLSLLAFLAVLKEHAGGRSLATFSLILASAGAGVDLLCDALQILVLPRVAAGGDQGLFLVCERGLDAGGLIPANGLYSIACLLAALALRKEVPPYVRWLGFATFAGGMLMAAAGFSGEPAPLELSSGATMSAFLAWSLAVTRALLVRERG
jgi:hypothetical protein